MLVMVMYHALPFPALKNIFFDLDIADTDFVKDLLGCAS